MKASVAEAGFSLVELVITIAVMSITVVAMLFGWSMLAQRNADVTWQARTAYIGQTYLEEILTKRFDENTSMDNLVPCGVGTTAEGITMQACSTAAQFGVVPGSSPLRSRDGEARDSFDDVDDYHGLSEVPLSLLGNLFSGANPYQAYRVSVSVVYDTALISTTNMVKRVTVTVTPPGEAPVVFSAYRGNY